MASQRHNSDGKVDEATDNDQVPHQHRVERQTSKRGGTRRHVHSGNAPSEQNHRRPQSPQAALANESLWARTVHILKGSVETLAGIQEPQEWDRDVHQTEVSQLQTAELEQEFQDTLKGKDRERMEREKVLQGQIHQAQEHAAQREKEFRAKIHDIQLAKSALEAQHNAFIREQQETSFGQMESARWLPEDETKVLSDLDKLKRDMRSWAKRYSIKDVSTLQTLGDGEYTALMQHLSTVVVFDNDDLPEGIFTTAKSPMLLLNALLADHVYMTFFRSPFFFLRGTSKNSSSNSQPEGILENIYQQAKRANPQDAHIWRSQTLRLLMPPLRTDISDREKKLHHTTEESIAKVAQQQAATFLTGPASLLVDNSTKSDFTPKLQRIYNNAAIKSYILWTRRIELRCHTLREIEQLDFDAESPAFDPDALMRHENHEDQLKGRPVTVLVHPLLEVAGTDEAKDYDQTRVWAKGVVWLDSKTT